MGFNRFYVLIVTTDYHNNIRKLAVVIYNFLQLIYLVTHCQHACLQLLWFRPTG